MPCRKELKEGWKEMKEANEGRKRRWREGQRQSVLHTTIVTSMRVREARGGEEEEEG
jgi:hypothetical protein